VLLQLTGGNVHDSQPVLAMLDNLSIDGSNIIGDKAYSSKEIREYIKNQEATYTIPPKSNEKNPWNMDKHLYKERHLVECFFNKIKHFRRVSTRYDKLATSFLAFVFIASIFRVTQ
jgi:transposase